MCLCVKPKSAYEVRIRYWSSDVCASDLEPAGQRTVVVDGNEWRRDRLAQFAGQERHALVERVARHRTGEVAQQAAGHVGVEDEGDLACPARKSAVSGKGEYVRVDLGGRLSLTKNTRNSLRPCRSH